VKISERTLRKQKERLEQVVSERTAEVVQQKQQIEAQKVDLETAYTGIQDSIHYSQRIQQAILPTSEDVRKIVPDSFVLFYPRDIVSGDFYWLAEREERRFIACVDCTGHGVPGALMSMIGNTLLNQIILEKNITAPEEVLNSLHEGVRHALKQDAGGDTRDGMDIALISLDKNNTELRYAGANRNLWIVRKGQLVDIKANKFPIAGIQEDQRRFTGHTLPLQKGDCIYLSTDGYADQFGGPRGKKFMVKQLTNLLAGMRDLPMTEQRTVLEHKFNEWRGHNEQVDDVLVIGIRID
jgi:serine phosphatase RsbU (regulator of sigma subunit)